MIVETNELGALGYGLTALAFLAFWLMLLTGWRKRLQGLYLLTAVAASFFWAVIAAFNAYSNVGDLPSMMFVVELIMMSAWLVMLIKMASLEEHSFLTKNNRAFIVCLGVTVGCELLLYALGFFIALSWVVFQIFLIGFIVLSVLGLVLVEQIYRSTKKERRWAIKFFVIGVGALFAYDFYMFSDALLFGRIDAMVWYARGYIAVFLVPLIALFVIRNPKWSFDIFISRGIVFHSVALVAVGGYLLLMAVGGYYIQIFGGDWGRAFQALFLFGALLLLVVVLLSGRFRSYLRVFVNKHFFNYKYDYREEWLGFTKTLSDPLDADSDIYSQVLRALLDLVDSPEGVLWVASSQSDFFPRAHIGMLDAGEHVVKSDDSLALFLDEAEWVINIDEYRKTPEIYHGLELGAWLNDYPHGWLISPLIERERLIAFALFSRPRSERSFNWEDSDLLKAAGRQAAVSLSQYQMSQALVDTRQFEAYNHFSTFVVHDIKNMVAQLSLMVRNADKYKHNPEFVDDMVETTRNSVGKMERLITQLRTGKESFFQSEMECVDLKKVLTEVVEERSHGTPSPELSGVPETDLLVETEKSRLEAIIGHLVQNAQDATPTEGRVTVGCTVDNGYAWVSIQDTGCGMSESFIRSRLFRPFDSTKGSAGMGIGAYESREYILQAGGRLEVKSEEGAGSVFHVILPLSNKLD